MNAIELLYGTSDRNEIVKQKTSKETPQVRALASSVRGKVELDATQCAKMCKGIGLEYLPGYESRVLQYKITDATKDRYGDKVIAKGGDLTQYRKNPVVQFAHDYTKLPVGNSLLTKYVKQDDAIYALACFLDDRVDTSGLSDLVFRFASSGAMKACSIGFVPVEYTIPKNEEERAALGVGDYGVVFDKWELMEFSAVPVPANPNALQDDVVGEFRKSLRSGLFTAKDVRTLMDFPVFEDKQLDAVVKELGDAVIIKPEIVEKACEDSSDIDFQFSIEDGASSDAVPDDKIDSLVSSIKGINDALDTKLADLQKNVDALRDDLKALSSSVSRDQNAEKDRETNLYRSYLGL